MNDRTKSTMLRRHFFATLAAGAAGLMTGLPLIHRFFRKDMPGATSESSITVKINPLAVPREKKGETSNG